MKFWTLSSTGSSIRLLTERLRVQVAQGLSLSIKGAIMAKKAMGLQEFGIKYFDKRSKTRGNRNPIRKRARKSKDEVESARFELKRAIEDGKHDHLLSKCAISGARGKFELSIFPAIVKVSKAGGFDTLKVLIHKDISSGYRMDNGCTVLSINKSNMKAAIKIAQLGDDITTYLHIFQVI